MASVSNKCDVSDETLKKWASSGLEVSLAGLGLDREGLYIWIEHTRQMVARAGDKWPAFLSRSLPLLPLQLVKGKYRGPRIMMDEWIGFQPMRSNGTTLDVLVEGEWTNISGIAVSDRMNIPLDHEAPHYGSHIRLDDECQYWENMVPVIGSEMDAEVVRDLANNSTDRGTIHRNGCRDIMMIGEATIEALRSAISDMKPNLKGTMGSELAGHFFAIMPKQAAAGVFEHEFSPWFPQDVEAEDVKKEVGSIYWGTTAQGIKLYSHSSLTDKIVVGFKPDDPHACLYHYQPYGFSLIVGTEMLPEGHRFKDKAQLLNRRMKKLAKKPNDMYGVIGYVD